MKKILTVGGTMAAGAVMAAGTDPTTIVSDMSTLANSILVVAGILLAWAVGSRLVRRYVK